MVALLHEDLVFHNVAGGQLTHQAHGIAEFRAMALNTAVLFSQREQRVLSIQGTGAEDDRRLVLSIGFSGVLAQEFPGVGRPGETIDMTGESEFAFCEGKIARIVDRS